MKVIIAVLLSMAIIPFFSSCEKEDGTDGTGQLVLSLTDAPIDDSTVTGVFITVTGISYKMSNAEWQDLDFDGLEEYNLLELTGGDTALLGQFQTGAGQYNQIRFMLQAPERGQGPPTSPGCYIEFIDGTKEALFVPSGSQSGFKATGSFDVPVNGAVSITADFDARKSVVKTGNQDRYLLKPTIRLIVNNQAGDIAGPVSGADSLNVVVYAYEDGAYDESEAAEPAEEATRFPNAVTSALVCDDGNYRLAFLAAWTYDVVVVNMVDGEFSEVLGLVEDVVVESQKTTSLPIDPGELNENE